MEDSFCRIENINETDSEAHCLRDFLKDNYEEIKKLPLVKVFIKEKKNEQLLADAFEKGDPEAIRNLDIAFQEFSRKQHAIKYAIGVLKQFPIDYDKRVKKRNNHYLLILDKPIKNNSDSSNTTLIEMIQDPHLDEPDNIFNDSIFEFHNEKLQEAVASLTSFQQKILRLIYLENHTQREVSKIIGQTEQNIYYWHKKTIKQLSVVI